MRHLFITIAITGIIAGFLILFARTHIGVSLRSGIFRLFLPLMRTAEVLRESIGFSTPALSPAEVRELLYTKEQFAALRTELESLRKENETLTQALRFKEETRLPFLGARVLIVNREGGREYVVIDRGSRDGVAQGDFVISTDRLLVGKIEQVDALFSRVGLASDAGRSYEGRLLFSGVNVLVKGLGGRGFSVELIPADATVRQGDLLVSAEKGFPPFPIGELVSFHQNSASVFGSGRAALLVHPELLKEVLVLPLSSFESKK